MELILPQNIMDFDFHSARTSPHASPPLTPRRFGESYFSAPTSPSRATEFYREFDDKDCTEFDFQFCSDMQTAATLSSADDLFEGGRIRPRKVLSESEIIIGDSAAGTGFNSSPMEKKHSNLSDQKFLRKWKLRDFLLFRSASEGRTSAIQRTRRSSGLPSDDSDSFGSETGPRRKPQMSAHELHYTQNKAASKSWKNKTYLPYKQGIFARLF